ncbi:hypothetical protein [Acinetobacter sp. UBA6720]|uniref:hypothetical protein n=1 Tax=Acinetobacter sp. UBA6720 TaxID=1945953 RepID=UPI0025C5C160|nr:hypothetical protein [Acinetobacter sp. UBA6720]
MSLNSRKIVEFSILALFGFTLYFGVTAYHDWKYEQALKSDHQIRDCGEFIEKTEIIRKRFGRSDSIEPIYTFKNTHGDLFSFSGGKQVIKHLPRLTLLKPQQPVCFQYSPVSKDKNGFFLLTNLH